MNPFKSMVIVLIGLGACTGPTGPNGAPGDRGATGSTGSPGSSGVNGKNALVATQPEPAGANCPSGGTAVLVGIDTDSDGMLRGSEVSTTSFICNTAASLSLTAAVAPGALCPLGGVSISTGTDTNNNGTLEPGEVKSTQTLCGYDVSGQAVVGDVVIANSADYNRFKNIRSLTGQLTISNSRLEGILAFPSLAVAGAINIANSPLVTGVQFPALTTLTGGSTGGLVSQFTALNIADLELPLLTRVFNSLTISANPKLMTIALPELQRVDFTLQITGNGAATARPTSVGIPALVSSNFTIITGNPFLIDCSLQSLRAQMLNAGASITQFTVSGNGAGAQDAGLATGCDPAATCWRARPTTPFRLLADAGQQFPDWYVDGGRQVETFTFCTTQVTSNQVPPECLRIAAGTAVSLQNSLKNQVYQSRFLQFGANFASSWTSGRDLYDDGGLTNPDGGWQWVSAQENASYLNFRAGEPNGGNFENCLQFNNTSGQWVDVNCGGFLGLTCEAP
jgi:hypothetical protein